jgi:hypothetical protein
MEHNPSGLRPLSAVDLQGSGERPLPLSARAKARQASKIRELAEAVESAGFLTLDEQAKALGVPRSTAWTIRRASHKASGLSASIIKRMLAAPELPALARSKIIEYVEEKAAGLYGGSRSQRRRFAAQLSIAESSAYEWTEPTLSEANRNATMSPETSRVTAAKPQKPLDFRANY